MEMLYFATGLICFNLQNVAAYTPTVAKATSDLIESCKASVTLRLQLCLYIELSNNDFTVHPCVFFISLAFITTRVLQATKSLDGSCVILSVKRVRQSVTH